MSVKYIAQVWEDETIDDRCSLLLMLALADFANAEGVCWPSIESLAKKARCSTRSVFDRLTELETVGKIKRVSGKKQNAVNVYSLYPSVQSAHTCEPPLKAARAVAHDPSGTVTDPSSQKITGANMREFTDAWCVAYERHFQTKYVFNKGRDPNAAKVLLESGLKIDKLLDIAKAAWAAQTFWAKQAASIVGFASRFNEIRNELQLPSGAAKHGDDAWDADKFRREQGLT
jgi:hypothetical protein